MTLRDESRQFRVRAMTGSDRDDMAVEGAPGQGKVPDDVQDLVSHELVGKAERFLAQDRFAPDDQGIFKASPLDQTLFHQVLHVLVVDKGARGSDLVGKDFGCDLKRQILGEAAVGAHLGAGNAEPIVGEDRHDRAAGGLKMDRIPDFKGMSGRFLLDDAGLPYERNKWCRAPVADRRLIGVHLDEGVVHPESRQCG